ncbi:MAG: hypothetical protein MR517_00875 [Bacteroidales bacterium]|nr:hypothetical protein [Bacteroidales bacterium]
MKRRLFLTLAFILSLAVHAQIGYQVSLLNSKTGEPHVNETVSVKIEITDSEGSMIYSANQNATTNDFVFQTDFG